MIDRDFFHEIWITLSRNKFRSALTCFGVLWGIFILILLLGLCEGVYYQVAGVIAAKSSIYIAGNPNEGIVVPFNTLQQTKSAGSGFRYLSVTIKEEYSANKLFAQVKDILKRQNKIAPSDEQAIVMVNIAQEFERYQNIYKAIPALTWIIGLGTLLSGIILILGLNLLFFVDFMLSFNAAGTSFLRSVIVKFDAAVYVLLFLMACGIISGFLPALKGLLVKPIDAIQCE
jgi:hypothetical protein